jgi:hypothetical protein
MTKIWSQNIRFQLKKWISDRSTQNLIPRALIVGNCARERARFFFSIEKWVKNNTSLHFQTLPTLARPTVSLSNFPFL